MQRHLLRRRLRCIATRLASKWAVNVLSIEEMRLRFINSLELLRLRRIIGLLNELFGVRRSSLHVIDTAFLLGQLTRATTSTHILVIGKVARHRDLVVLAASVRYIGAHGATTPTSIGLLSLDWRIVTVGIDLGSLTRGIDGQTLRGLALVGVSRGVLLADTRRWLACNAAATANLSTTTSSATAGSATSAPAGARLERAGATAAADRAAVSFSTSSASSLWSSDVCLLAEVCLVIQPAFLLRIMLFFDSNDLS